MKFSPTKLKGSYVIDIEPQEDERGFFARSWCRDEFKINGLEENLVQCSISFNKSRGTLRGLHYQIHPHEETKIVRCTQGSIFDVIVDLRSDSSTFKDWFGVELSAENRRMLYVPGGFAHGFLTLMDETEVFYQMSEFFHQESARGVRWNDPAFSVKWPEEIIVISERDNNYPDYSK